MVPYKQLGRDAGGEPMHDFAIPFKALVTRLRENAAASSVITLGDNTTELEIAATGAPAYIRFVSTTDTAASVVSTAAAANFDFAIASNSVRRFPIPIEAFVAQSSIVGLNKQYGLYNRVAIIGAASVASTEY